MVANTASARGDRSFARSDSGSRSERWLPLLARRLDDWWTLKITPPLGVQAPTSGGSSAWAITTIGDSLHASCAPRRRQRTARLWTRMESATRGVNRMAVWRMLMETTRRYILYASDGRAAQTHDMRCLEIATSDARTSVRINDGSVFAWRDGNSGVLGLGSVKTGSFDR